MHLVGIGGSGLSAIARVLHERGDVVSGSDREPNERTESLARDGVAIAVGQRAENVAGVDLLLVSSAIGDDNPEVAAARLAGIPVLRRQAFLGALTTGLRTIAVAGTHGKTTTTALIAWILHQAGRQPGYILGGISPDLGGNGAAGGGSTFVIEADEYDRAFLGLHPAIGVVTNVEYDHPDLFPAILEYQHAFEAFVHLVEEKLIVCQEDPVAASLIHPTVPRETYGWSAEADWRAADVRPNSAGGSDFLAFHGEASLGLIQTRLPGRHNVLNALAALAAVDSFEIPLAVTRQALTEFQGVERRFAVLGESAGVVVIDDYAHHPTEIRATLEAVRTRWPGREVWAVFQPHTFSRTRALAADFARAFGQADHVVVTAIFASRERPEMGIDGAWLVAKIVHEDVRHAESLEEAAAMVIDGMQPPAVVVTLSAGDANRVGQIVLDDLRGRGSSGKG
ncbi:MAG TPA: UDP-N-acetylmuramate--L-alanine ligase [Anaerolineales bacterium]|nr:UDP-N-acetylmuramate--L-alanine ligase [Anaerolineales bacterium]